MDSGEELSAAGGNRKEGRGQRRFLTSRRTPGTPRWRRRCGGNPCRRWRTSAAAQRTAGERGQRKLGRERGNWGVSRVADVEAKLTVAEGTAGLQRRRRNGLGTAAVNGGGALACEQRGGGGREVCRRGVRGTRSSGRRLRGDGGADSPGPRAERAGEAGADAGKAAALTGRPARAEREGGEGRRARGMGQMGRKAEGGGGVGFFPFFLLF
jgi:hypothetical protein